MHCRVIKLRKNVRSLHNIAMSYYTERMCDYGKFRFAIDRGGTFTDVFAKCPGGKIRVLKLLSEDPQHYKDAPTEGIRRILQEVWKCLYTLNRTKLKDTYVKKFEIAQKLCEKHALHRSMLHAKKSIDDNTTDSKLTEMFVQSLPPREATKVAAQTWILSDLNPFIIKPVETQVEEKQPIEYLTEMREVTIQFINIIPSVFSEVKLVSMLNKAYQIICGIVSKVRGVVNKLSLFDKDAMILVLFGLKGVKHELESQNALKSAYAIRQALSKLNSIRNVSVGITNGLVYCGVVGHPFRREYTVIGGAVNKAARIMCAYTDKVTCDHETYKNCKLTSAYFQLQSALKLKGIENAGHIFEYNEAFEKLNESPEEGTPLIGRSRELEFIDLVIESPGKIGNFCGVCFRGEPKVGKSKLLEHTLRKYAQGKMFIASIVLHETIQRPYFCISSIYKQLFDIMSTERSSVLQNLPRDLWDLNEILQNRPNSRNQGIEHNFENVMEKASSNFRQLCRGIPEKYGVIFIDNIQYIDQKSLKIIDSALQQKLVRLISAGCFDDDVTWDIMWKLSLSNHIKLLDLDPLKSNHMIQLMLDFLNVKGVSKRLVSLLVKTCEGRPGWIQACLLRLVNNGELEIQYSPVTDAYLFQQGLEGDVVVPVACLSQKYFERSEDLTLAAISLDLFDSFSPYQQLIIKTAAVLGKIFTRMTLIILLKYPNETHFAIAIKDLFEEEVFDCASRYVNSGGLQVKKIFCQCYMDDADYAYNKDNTKNNNVELPRYAFCKLLHFKSKNLRSVAYDLLPGNQKKELHLKITDLLENQKNFCPNCLRDNSASIINLRKFREMIEFCNELQPRSLETSDLYHNNTEIFKNIIRAGIRTERTTEAKKIRILQRPKRKVWDPTTCFCLEILTKVYSDLAYHSHCADHLGKKIYFMFQYCNILLLMNELEEIIPLLGEASELCMGESKDQYMFYTSFRKMMIGKIHMLQADVYYRLGNLPAAKNHILISLRQYNVPMISFNYTIPHRIMTRSFLNTLRNMLNTSPRFDNEMVKLDFGICMNIVSNIYAAEGRWEFSKAAADRSVCCLRRTTHSNVQIICDIYSNAIDLYSYCGDMHICEKLETDLNKDLMYYESKNYTIVLYSISRMIIILFNANLISGKMLPAIRLGYRAEELLMSLQAYYFQIQLIPRLATALLLLHRIEEAVYMARILYNIGKKYHISGYVAYYSFCVELLTETNFCLESIDCIEDFARHHFKQNRSSKGFTNLENKLIIFLYDYNLRFCSLSKSIIWKNIFDWNADPGSDIICLQNLFKSTECILLELVRNMEMRKMITQIEEAKAVHYLKDCENVANKWAYFRARYFHFKAYFYRIKSKKGRASSYLKIAKQEAETIGNILEQCWIGLHLSSWSGGFSFAKGQVNAVNWKFAKTYNQLQWSQIMYSLPYF